MDAARKEGQEKLFIVFIKILSGVEQSRCLTEQVIRRKMEGCIPISIGQIPEPVPMSRIRRGFCRGEKNSRPSFKSLNM